MTKQVIIIGQDGHLTVSELPKENGLEFFQTAVGGWVQCVDLSQAFEGISLWVNEEGKLDSRFGRNEIATFIWEQSYGKTDVIVGNAVFTGGADDEGETLGLTPEQVNLILTTTLLAKALV